MRAAGKREGLRLGLTLFKLMRLSLKTLQSNMYTTRLSLSSTHFLFPSFLSFFSYLLRNTCSPLLHTLTQPSSMPHCTPPLGDPSPSHINLTSFLSHFPFNPLTPPSYLPPPYTFPTYFTCFGRFIFLSRTLSTLSFLFSLTRPSLLPSLFSPASRTPDRLQP